MIVGIHQPHYLPWLRYVDKIARSDVFVLLDDVQYTKNGWQNRNKIKGAQGWMYLTVPVREAFGKSILDVRINNQERWRQKHWMALRTNYARAPHFARYAEVLEDLYGREWDRLCDLNVALLERLLSLLGIGTRLVRSSALDVPGRGSERVADICARLGATAYLTGDYAATNHLDAAALRARGIEVRPQGWRCVEYPQQYPQAGFVPHLSIVDLLFNQGNDSRAVLERCRPPLSEITS
jgi:hypothetical protein